MRFRNRDGESVDAIPFLVTGSVAFLVLFSFAPGYLLSLGLDVAGALATTAVVFGVTVVAAYHQQVHAANPTRREEVPASVRFRRLMYAVLVAIALMLLLLFPIVAG